MAAPFSRLQLAAALIEYDNDSSNPEAPYRSAQDSAIFAHLRYGIRPRPNARKSSDYLGVSLPSETGSVGGRESRFEGHKSRASINTLGNPFRASVHVDDDEEQEHPEEMEVDLTSWGLDAFMPKDKDAKGKAKEKSPSLPNPHPLSSVNVNVPQARYHTNIGPGRTTRSLSVGNYDHLVLPGDDNRRKSFGSPLDLSGVEPSLSLLAPRRSAALDDLPASSSAGIPFPTGSAHSPSPLPNDSDLLYHQRPYSRASMGSQRLLNEEGPVQRPHSRAMSSMTMGSLLPSDDNPFALLPPSRASKFDPKAAVHARTMSNASLGSRIPFDNDGISVMTGPGGPQDRDRRHSTMELLRPKVLVMPSPLQSTKPPAPPPDPTSRNGFQVSTDGPPLPPGARSSRNISSTLSMMGVPSPAPIASNSFTPNPRMNLSLSQLTFRNNLMVGGQRDVAYSDIDSALPRATVDGEQVHPYADTVAEALPEPSFPQDELHRPAGKLYGKSLIDDLESRKAAMRSKQRVFRGDDRPSMMSREELKRGSTLIDPTSLQPRPASQRMSSFGEIDNGLNRPNSNIKPLLNFSNERLPPSSKAPPTQISAARSVFGVDTLWEREMAKLKEIEAQEKLEREEVDRRAVEAEAKLNKKKRKGKGKKAAEDALATSPITPTDEPSVPESRVSVEPPTLPIFRSTLRQPPPVVDDGSESEGSDADNTVGRPAQVETTGWNAGSSDEDNGPRRTTGVGLRNPKKRRSRPINLGTSSEEDVPLAATINKAILRTTRLPPQEGDSDEEQPLSALLHKVKSKSSLLPSVDFDHLSVTNQPKDDDDDKPLGLRASRVAPSSHALGDDDDQPLGLHPEQQRRVQYQQMMIMQQQQQQMMLQAQMTGSMFFNPAMMGSGFFPSPVGPAPMLAPMQVPSPPPVQDAAKYGRVDQWRHNVAVEGDS